MRKNIEKEKEKMKKQTKSEEEEETKKFTRQPYVAYWHAEKYIFALILLRNSTFSKEKKSHRYTSAYIPHPLRDDTRSGHTADTHTHARGAHASKASQPKQSDQTFEQKRRLRSS